MFATKYFTYNELTFSVTALKNNISNIPDTYEEKNLEELARHLDKIREIYGKPIKVNSGFRCKRLNKAVGGSDTSNHLAGRAADITGSDLRRLKRIVLEYAHLNPNNMNNGKKRCSCYEIIFYPTFVHFAFRVNGLL